MPNNETTLFTRAATIGATSWNEQARTLDVVFATSNPVERQDHRGAYLERLDMGQDWTPFVGAPVLDSHQRGKLGDVLGSVIAAKTVGNEGHATIQISKRRKAAAIVDDIKAGHIRGVSVGYRVSEWKDTTESGKRLRTATKWSPAELSIVAVGADPGAVIRSQPMETNQTQTEDTLVVGQTLTDDTLVGGLPLKSRAAENAEIREIARVAGLRQAWIDTQIDNGVTVETARASAFAAMTARSELVGDIRTATASVTGHDANDPEWRQRTIGEAVFSRMSGATPSEAARPYAALTMVELAKDCLRTRGMMTTGNPATVVERAMTTSDLPAIMADSVNRSLRLAYEAAPSGVRMLARQTTARDFRKQHRIQLSAAPTLMKVNENGEFHSGAIADQEETYRIETFGRIISLSRQAFVNDSLGALSDLTRRMGLAAAEFENGFLVDLVQSNPVLADTYAVFSSQHKNLAATGTVMSQDSLSAARLAMRKQTEMTGVLINVTPKYLLVPPALETLAEKTVTSVQSTKTDDVNVMSFLNVIVEPRLTSATAWYLVSDPATFDGLEYCYLEGEPGPQTFSEIGFVVDGVAFKIREDFGGGWVEPRGWYRNGGA